MNFENCWCILFWVEMLMGLDFWDGGSGGCGVGERGGEWRKRGKQRKKVRLYLVAVVAVEKNHNFFRKKLLTYNGGVVS